MPRPADPDPDCRTYRQTRLADSDGTTARTRPINQSVCHRQAMQQPNHEGRPQVVQVAASAWALRRRSRRQRLAMSLILHHRLHVLSAAPVRCRQEETLVIKTNIGDDWLRGSHLLLRGALRLNLQPTWTMTRRRTASSPPSAM